MPSLLGRIFNFSFRTERLIMNIIGLINSTFDWNPLKWTNELEQIRNISLSYSTLILETIGEDTIKAVLSWIVITRIVIAHVYTLSYLMNIYPILTWSRPNLLLPWLILSFFKNVVLEVIVLAVCLLLWYDKRFSLTIFLEFILVKIVPLILATYNWYSNSCLFFHLRHTEKMMELKKHLRSDMNFLSNRLFSKFAGSKYRCRSLTTLLSYESYETFDSHDTISRIIEDPNLTAAQKTMKMLGLTQQDIIKARIRKKERVIRSKLTETDDDLLNITKAMDRNMFLFDEEYEEQMKMLLKFRDEEHREEDEIEESIVVNQTPLPLDYPKKSTAKNPAKMIDLPKKPKVVEEVHVSEPPSKKIKEEKDTLRINETKQNKERSSTSKDNSLPKKEDATKARNMKCDEKDEENSNDSTKPKSVYNCDCLIDENLLKEIKERCCRPDNSILKTSTPKGSPNNDQMKRNLTLNDVNNECEHSCLYNCSIVKDKTSRKTKRNVPSVENMLKNDLQLSVNPENRNLIKNIEKNPCSERLKGKLGKEDGQVVNKMGNLSNDEVKILKNPCLGKLEEQSGQIVNQMENLLKNVQQDPFLSNESRKGTQCLKQTENLLNNDVTILKNPYLGKLEEESGQIVNQMENLLKNVQQTSFSREEIQIVNRMENVQKNDYKILENIKEDPYLKRLVTEVKLKEEIQSENQMENFTKNVKGNSSVDNDSRQEAPLVNKMENLSRNDAKVLENSCLEKLEGKLKNEGERGANEMENLLKNVKQNSTLDRESKRETQVFNKMENVQKNDYKILENIKGDPYLKRLVTEVKLKKETKVATQLENSLKNIKQHSLLNSGLKQEVQVVNKMENIKGNASLEKLTTEGKLKQEVANKMEKELKTDEEILKTVRDDSYTKIPIVEEDWKQRVRRVTNNIENLLQSYQEQKGSKKFIINEKPVQQVANQVESNESVPNRSESINVQHLSKFLGDAASESVQNFGILTVDVEESKVKLRTGNETPRTMDPMKSTVLIGINSTQKSNCCKAETVKDKSKGNLPEYSFGDATLQCLLQQFENWKPFAHQSNVQTPSKRSVEINQSTVQNFRNISSQTRDYEKIDRSKATVTSPPKKTLHPENLISQKTQVNEQSLDNISNKLNHPYKSPAQSKGSYNRTNSPNASSKTSSSTITDPASRKKVHLKRKRLKKQSSIDKQTTFPNTQKPESAKHHENQRKQPYASKSPSESSVCECKMQQLEAKCSPSSESRLEKKEEPRRPKMVDTFGTATLAQVTRPSDFPNTVYRKKPPMYPKKNKAEESPQTNPVPKITPMIKKLQESKKSKSRSWKDDREMRALKVYNEDTLWRDKRELDAKRKFPSGRSNVDLLPEDFKHRASPKKNNSRKRICQDTKLIPEEQLDKENLAESSVEVDSSPPTVMSSRLMDEDDKTHKSSNEEYTCSKLSKVNRVTDKILDRLFSIQKQGRKRLATEMDNRKQVTKYSKPKRMIDEEVISASSSKRLEGVQKGRELERTPAKEDIRGQVVNATGLSRGQITRIRSNEENKSPEKLEDRLLMTIKPSVNQDVASKWSSSTIDQAEELLSLEDKKYNDPTIRLETTFDPEDASKEPLEDSKVQREPVPIKQHEIEPEESSSNVTEALEDDDDSIRRRSTNYTDFTRSIDVSHLIHGVVLTNTNAPRSKSPRLRDIVDDNTSRLLHEAFSYQSMDSILDFAEDNLTFNDIMNERHPNTLDDGFVCQASNDALDVFSDELAVIPQDPSNLSETIPIVLREARNLDQQEENCDLFITIDGDVTTETLQVVGFNEFQSSNVLSTIGEALRTLNVREFGLASLEDSRSEILQDLEIENRDEEVEEGSEEDDGVLRFIKEDVFTDIKFPVVINWSDSVVVSDEDPEALNSATNDKATTTKPTELLNLIGSNDEKKIEEEEELGSEENRNLERSVFFAKLKFSSEEEEPLEGESEWTEENVGSKTFFLDDFKSGTRGNVSSEEVLERSRQTMTCFESEARTSGAKSEESRHTVKETVHIFEEALGYKIEEENDKLEGFEKMERKSVRFEQSEETDRNIRLNDFEDEEEELLLIEENMEMEQIEEIERNIKLTDFEGEKEKITLIEEILKLKIEEINKNIQLIDSKNKNKETIVIEESLKETLEEIIKNIQQNDSNETILLEESMELEEIEESVCNAHLISSGSEKEEIIQISKSDDEENKKVIEKVMDSQKNEESEEEQKSTEEMTLLITCIFWITIFLSFVKNWYQNLRSLDQASRSTSTLKPFDIHAVPLSTMKLIEKIEKEESDLLKKITEENSQSTKQHSRISSHLITDNISSGIIEMQDNDSEETEKEIEEAMLFLSEHISENVKIPSFSSSNEEKPPSNLLLLTSKDGEVIDKNIFEAENGKFGEEEIQTFRFEEVDDSGSTESFFEHDYETELFDDGRLSSLVAEVKIDEEEIEENVDERRNEEDRRFLKDKTIAEEKTEEDETIAEEKTEKAEGSSETKQTSTSKLHESNLKNMDSFDSTYSKISSTSKYTTSDLNGSSMEEFERN